MKTLTDLLDIAYPVIQAPMFLVSNTAMVKAALDNGITGAIPALNYRSTEELRNAIREIKAYSGKPFGINLIVNKSNPKFKSQLKVCIEERVAFFITSLGNPEEVIRQAHEVDIRVFCDTVDASYAKKAADAGADALIAVNNEAGGHLGHLSAEALYRELSGVTNIPLVAAGGVASGERLQEILDMGYAGASVGTIFIPTHECGVSQAYKQACVDYNADDVVITTKLSGTPCTVINTPYVQQTGTRQNWLERLLNKNKTLKKYVKMLVFMKGIKKLQKAAFSNTYKTVWCAGPSIERVDRIKPVREVVQELVG